MKSLARLLAPLCMAVFLAACGGGDDSAPAAPPAPVANAGTDQSVEYGTVVTLDASASSSPRIGATLTYAWTLVSRPVGSGAELDNAGSATPSFLADVPGTYELNLSVSDGTASSTDRVLVTATNPDPVAVAQPEHNVLIGTAVTLDGSSSVPPTGGSASELVFQWTLTARPDDSSAALWNAGAAMAGFYADKAGTYTATLTVAYRDKTSEPLTVTITASTANTKPVANAGGPYTVERGKPLTLDGTLSSDADGDALSYRWYLLSPDNASGSASIWTPNGSARRLETGIQGYDTATPTITPDTLGNWSVYLQVYDGTTLSSSVLASITVTKPEGAANTPPVASFFATPRVSFYTPKYSDEVELGSTVWSSGSSWDIDGTYISNRRYRWISTPAGYVADDLTGKTSFSFTPTVEGQYTVEMTVNDGEADSAPVQRTFTARTGANRAPTASIAVDSSTILVGSTGWFDARASSDLDGDQLTYTWHLFDRPDGSTATLRYENVTREDGVVLANARAGVVADKPGVYIVLLAVTDSHGVTNAPTSVYYGRVVAKAQNNAPSIDRISNNNDQFSFRRRNTHYNDSDQPYIIGDESVTLYSINAVDPDLDTLYYLWTLQQPAGSALTDAAVTADFTPGAPTVEGDYSATLIVSDGIATSESKSLDFKVVARENYPSLLLEDYYSAAINYWDRNTWVGGVPADPRHRAFPYWHHDDASFPVFVHQVQAGDNVIKNYRLTAYGGDYTITNLRVGTSTNAGYPGYSGKFTGLADGQVIRRGESVDFSLVLTGPGGQETTGPNNNVAAGIVYTFEVVEKPGWTFEYQPWVY